MNKKVSIKYFNTKFKQRHIFFFPVNKIPRFGSCEKSASATKRKNLKNSSTFATQWWNPPANCCCPHLPCSCPQWVRRKWWPLLGQQPTPPPLRCAASWQPSVGHNKPTKLWPMEGIGEKNAKNSKFFRKG